MLRLVFGILLLAICPTMVEAAKPKYGEGQVWSYRTRPQDVGSLLKIYKVESTSIGKIYHVSVIFVRFPTSQVGNELPHFPVSSQTLDASVLKRIKRPPSFPDSATEQGIAQWRSDRGGVFTIPVKDIITTIETTIFGVP